MDKLAVLHEMLWTRLCELGWGYTEEHIEEYRVNTIYLHDKEYEEVLVTIYDPHCVVDALYMFMPTAPELVRLLAYPDQIVQMITVEYLRLLSVRQTPVFAPSPLRKDLNA